MVSEIEAEAYKISRIRPSQKTLPGVPQGEVILPTLFLTSSATFPNLYVESILLVMLTTQPRVRISNKVFTVDGHELAENQ